MTGPKSLLVLLCTTLLLSIAGANSLATTTTTAAMATSSSPPKYLNLTAIAAKDGKSTLECWQLTKPITVSSTAGTSGTLIQQLGDVSNASYVVLPPKFDGGKHTAPNAQYVFNPRAPSRFEGHSYPRRMLMLSVQSTRYVVFLSGKAHVTLPDSKDEATVFGGENGLIIAADTADLSKEGHITTYPGDTPTVALQIPFKDGKLPEHRVLHSGPCTECDRII